MKETMKGRFVPKNPHKYMGPKNQVITYRSSWELSVMSLFDKHPNVLSWSSETVSIPYRNPLTGRHTVYVPDFLVVYLDKHGRQHAEMIEVKPAKETPNFQRIDKRTNRVRPASKRDLLAQALNAAKWEAARAFCAKRSISFRVLTEVSIFGMT
jgi:hypothetical protein